MPLKFDVRQDDRWYTNTDFTVKYRIWEADGVTPRDVSAYALSWMLKTRDRDPDASALLVKTTPTITITGVFNVDPALNTQLVEVPIADTEVPPAMAGVRSVELKRTDATLETVLSKGLAVLLVSAHQS